MTDKMKGVLAAAAAVAALGVGGAAIAGAAGSDSSSTPQPAQSEQSEPAEPADGPEGNDSEAPIGGAALDKASAAALQHTPGQVTETEVGDEESYYEVEVTRDDGSQVDVQLDREFNVVGSEADGAGE
jgi:uncharacterized membrane protein YkoI